MSWRVDLQLPAANPTTLCLAPASLTPDGDTPERKERWSSAQIKPKAAYGSGSLILE